MAWMYHAYGKSATLSVTAPAPCGDPVGLPIGGEDGGSTRAGAVGGGSTGAGFGALATLGSSLSPGRGSAGPKRWGPAPSVMTAAAISALANRFRHHAESFDSRPAHAVHRLDDGAVGEAGVRLEIERLVRPVLERITEGLLEGAGREALVVEEESLFLGDGEDHPLFDRGWTRRRSRQVDVDAAIHHGRRQHEDEQEDEHHVDQRDDVDLGQRGADAARAVGVVQLKGHL